MMVMLDTETGKVVDTVPIGAGVDGCAFDDGRSSRSHPAETARRQSLEKKRAKIDGTANFEDRARRTDDGARSEDPPNLFADRTVSTTTVSISRRLPRTSQRCAQHTQAARLRSS
jgi:hypothetical protein